MTDEQRTMIDGTLLAGLIDEDLDRLRESRDGRQHHTDALYIEGERQGLALARAYLTGLLRAAK